MRCSNQLSYIAENCGRIIQTLADNVKHNFKKIRSGPISRVLSRTIIPLGVQSLVRSSDLPESSTGRASGFLFGLASGGVYLAVNCYQTRGALLPHPFTLTEIPPNLPFKKGGVSPFIKGGLRGILAVYSLLHLPSVYTAQALPGTLPYEARTFLPCFSHGDLHSSDRPAHFVAHLIKIEL